MWVVVDKTGKSMPVDADPVDNGNIELTGKTRATSQGGQAPECRYVAQGSLLTEADRYVSHFATCPDADHHRRGR